MIAGARAAADETFRLWQAGVSLEDIATQQGVSEKVILSRLIRRNVSIKAARRTNAKLKAFAEHRAKGLSAAAAAAAAGYSPHSASWLQHHYGSDIAKTPPPIPKERDDVYVAKLIQMGGLPRLSEKRVGDKVMACLPLIPYGAEIGAPA